MHLRRGTIHILVAAIGIGTLLEGCSLFDRSPLSLATSAMARAFAKRRLVEGRLSGDARAGKYVPPVEGESNRDRSGVDEDSLNTAYLNIDEAKSEGDPRAPLMYARLLVADGKWREALPDLQRAAAKPGAGADAHNDLGVSLLDAGRVDDALDQFEETLNIDPRMPAALFNRALCHQVLVLPELAGREFAEIEPLEKDRGWREEIRRRKEETRPLKEFNQEEESLIA